MGAKAKLQGLWSQKEEEVEEEEENEEKEEEEKNKKFWSKLERSSYKMCQVTNIYWDMSHFVLWPIIDIGLKTQDNGA